MAPPPSRMGQSMMPATPMAAMPRTAMGVDFDPVSRPRLMPLTAPLTAPMAPPAAAAVRAPAVAVVAVATWPVVV